MYKVKGFNKLTDYAEALGVSVPENDCEINSIKFDSRIAAKGDLFIPLEGSKFNGEDFVKTALRQGAAAITKQNLGGLVLHNDDVYECLIKLAKINLQNIRPKIIIDILCFLDKRFAKIRSKSSFTKSFRASAIV